MTYDIKPSARRKPENRFKFNDEFGNAHSIPKLQYAPAKALRLFESEKHLAALMEIADSDEVRMIFDDFDSEQLENFVNAWSEASEVDLGE